MSGIPAGTITLHEARNLAFQLITGMRVAEALDEIMYTESRDEAAVIHKYAKISAELARSDVILEQLWTQGILEVFAQSDFGATERLPREHLESCQGIRLASRISAHFPTASPLRKYNGATLFLISAELDRTFKELGIRSAKQIRANGKTKKLMPAAKRGRRAIYDWPSIEGALLNILAARGVPHTEHSMKWKSEADIMRWVQEWCIKKWGKEPGDGVTRQRVRQTISNFIKSQPAK